MSEEKEPRISVATQLVKLAENGFNLGVTPDGEPYAVPEDGPPIVRLLRGGKHSLRAEMARAFYSATGSAASQSALADALAVIEGQAHQEEPEDLHLRVAEHQGNLVLDLGDATGRCVVISKFSWQVVDAPPVLFRRTALTSPLPVPQAGSGFDALWKTLNVAERYRPVLLAVLVAALMPGMPHPVVLLTGEQGTGKSTATARLASIVDPSPAQLRKAPKDVESWTTAAAGSWVVPLDNLSGIGEWLSDAVCRASTGDGDVRRRLYTDGDLHVISFRRCVLINGIDVGALRGDLADRVVHLHLDRISDDRRELDEVLAKQWTDDHPKVLGALLDLAVQVMKELPNTKLDEMPRMADFAKVLATVDRILDTDGLQTYLGLRTELAQDAATSDPVLMHIIQAVVTEWKGTSAELLTKIEPSLDDNGYTWKPPKDWPVTSRQMTTVMTRQAPTLRQLGWEVGQIDRDADRTKTIKWRLNPPPPEPQEPREGEKHAADAAFAANGTFPQVNGHAIPAATTAANLRQTATDPSCRTDAAQVAAPDTPHLTSTNGHSAATAATAASNRPSLGSAG